MTTKTNNLPGKAIGKSEMKVLIGGWGNTYRCNSIGNIFTYACTPSAVCPSGCSLVTGSSGSSGGSW